MVPENGGRLDLLVTKNLRIALIHATPLAVQPVNEAFAADWPEATVCNLLEDSLAPDLARAGQLMPAMITRFERLAGYARDCGANGILFTCSAFGPAIESAAKSVAPLLTLKPNEAMFRDALKTYKHVGMIATFAASLPPMEREFHHMAEQAGIDVKLESVLAAGAMEALADGHAERHNQMIADAARTLVHCDALMLAQFSMAQAKTDISRFYERPVLTSPASAIAALKQGLLG
ncbi:MAG: arylsulfatase [Rhodospirillales bacterium]|nr:arylsulfatase [Rhodospirillales bacterium]